MSASDLAIELRGVGKRYVQFQEQAMLLKSLIPFRTAARTEHWALQDIDLTVARGETVGVIGQNGAGKTTLLRLLAGVTRPTEGRVTTRGRVAPLIGIGVGFHPEMSGRENVYVNGMLLGLTKAQVDNRFDEIVEFSEIESFIDTPVKFYSSGMFLRLGFAIAINVDPEILLVDELLAVGDLAFQLKCFDRMRQLNDSGTTIVVVSHSMHAIRLLCERAALIRAGRLEVEGPVEEVIARHEQLQSVPTVGASSPADDGAIGVRVVDRAINGPDGPVTHLTPGVPVDLRARVCFDAAVESPQVFFTVLADNGALAYQMRSTLNRSHRRFEPGDEADLAIRFTPYLTGGPFHLLLMITSIDGRRVLYRDTTGLAVDASAAGDAGGFVDLAATVSAAAPPS